MKFIRQHIGSALIALLVFTMLVTATPFSGQVVTLSDGTLAAPGLAYALEPGTGMYRSGAATNVLTSKGAARLTIGSSGVTANSLLTASSGITLSAGSNLTTDSGTATASSGAATLNKQSGTITSEALTTAAA